MRINHPDLNATALMCLLYLLILLWGVGELGGRTHISDFIMQIKRDQACLDFVDKGQLK